MTAALWSKIDKSGDCWLWKRGMTRGGYAKHTDGGRTVLGHRFMYGAMVGPIPAGMVLDHVCRTRNCVNPDHLEPVTQAENLRRASTAVATINASKTVCAAGHNYDDSNTYMRPTGGRGCRACRREATRRSQLKRLQEAA